MVSVGLSLISLDVCAQDDVFGDGEAPADDAQAVEGDDSDGASPENEAAPAEPREDASQAEDGEEAEATASDSVGARVSVEGTETSDGDALENDAPEKEALSGEAEQLFDSIGIRRVSAADAPSGRKLGIKGGSLAATTHGLQWPHMRDSGIGVSGYVWIDTGYEKIKRPDPNQPDTKYLLQEGRFLLRVTPTYTLGRWFIQGQAEFVANKDQASTQPSVVDADDVWGKVGVWDLFDIQVGRFEAWELYHFGMGMDINTLERRGATDIGTTGLNVPEVYGTRFAYYRPNGAGNVAAHVYPVDFFRFELLGQVGNQAGLNTAAFRGAGILDFGFVKIKGGGEYKKQKTTNDGPEERDERGAGGTIQFVFDPYIEFGGSGGWAITDRIDPKDIVDEQGSYTTWSAGGFLNVSVIEDFLVGGGVNYTDLWDTHKDENGDVGEFSHLQAFGAVQYALFGQLQIKAVMAWARGKFNPSFAESPPHTNTMLSGRLRFQYNF